MTGAMGNKSIRELGISGRCFLLLENNGIGTVRELCERSEIDLLRMKGCGRSMLRDVKDALHSVGASLSVHSYEPAAEPERRVATVAGTYVTTAERLEIEGAASRAGMSVRDWVRATLLCAARLAK